jgi:hypothetical protein
LWASVRSEPTRFNIALPKRRNPAPGEAQGFTY